MFQQIAVVLRNDHQAKLSKLCEIVSLFSSKNNFINLPCKKTKTTVPVKKNKTIVGIE